jgi:hypothetical protein
MRLNNNQPAASSSDPPQLISHPSEPPESVSHTPEHFDKSKKIERDALSQEFSSAVKSDEGASNKTKKHNFSPSASPDSPKAEFVRDKPTSKGKKAKKGKIKPKKLVNNFVNGNNSGAKAGLAGDELGLSN